jgi:1-acyl-sn-glycerol-3-phosphate acyltransferase
MRPGNHRAAVRGALFLGFTCFLIVTYPVVCAFGWGARRWIRRIWSRYTCWLLDIRVRARGTPSTTVPTLFVPNHVSYLDVVILGRFIDALFIAKAEVGGWPLFGYIARVTGTLFIKRHWRQARIQRDLLVERMREGESFVLFAEGTSSNGLAVKPFKTSLLSPTEPWVARRPVAAQAVTLGYLRLADGTPISTANCDTHAWYDDMEFAPHLWDVMKHGGLDVEVVFHEPVPSSAVTSRKVLGPQLRAEIADRLAGMRAGVAAEPVTVAAVGGAPVAQAAGR